MQALDGVKVLDLTHAIAGSFCSMLLGDMGAEVVKIEPPDGELFRPALGGAFSATINRNKRSIALNIATDEGRDVVLRLADQSDVFVENFTAGTVEKLGIDYETIKKRNPNIIYCSVSGFGQAGPFKSYPAFDPVIQALSGMMMSTGEADGKPVRIFPSLIDFGTAIYAAYGISLALRTRDKTGKGQLVDVALIDSALSWMCYLVAHYSVSGEIQERSGSAAPWGTPYQAFETSDDPIFIAVISNKTWKNFCRALELDDLMNDPRFDSDDNRNLNRTALLDILVKVFKQCKCEELLAKLQVVDVPCAPILTVDKMIDFPQVASREMFEDMDYPGLGKIKVTKVPTILADMPSRITRRASLLGEHTIEVLRELKYTEDEIRHLVESEIASQFDL